MYGLSKTVLKLKFFVWLTDFLFDPKVIFQIRVTVRLSLQFLTIFLAQSVSVSFSSPINVVNSAICHPGSRNSLIYVYLVRLNILDPPRLPSGIYSDRYAIFKINAIQHFNRSLAYFQREKYTHTLLALISFLLYVL